MHRRAVLIALLLSSIAWAPTASACSCEPVEAATPSNILERASKGALVYIGVVSGIDSTSNSRLWIYEVEVESTIGGEHSDLRHFYTEPRNSSCFMGIETGLRMLLVPNTRTREPTLDLCSARYRVVVDSLLISEVLAATSIDPATWAKVKASAQPTVR